MCGPVSRYASLSTELWCLKMRTLISWYHGPAKFQITVVLYRWFCLQSQYNFGYKVDGVFFEKKIENDKNSHFEFFENIVKKKPMNSKINLRVNHKWFGRFTRPSRENLKKILVEKFF